MVLYHGPLLTLHSQPLGHHHRDVLKVVEDGEVFLLPRHARHSPQRRVPGSSRLVVESPQMADMLDAFEWCYFECLPCIHQVNVPVNNIVDDLPLLYEAFYDDGDPAPAAIAAP